MIAFDVNGMTCGRCVSAITQALKTVDQAAEVHIDLAAHRVQIDASVASAAALADAIRDAGYSPTPMLAAVLAHPAKVAGSRFRPAEAWPPARRPVAP